VAVAEADAWFTYYYWLDDARAPDFARTVDIHRKPGYDPVELFMTDKLRAAARLAQKKLGFRYTMDVVPLDANLVKGSHGRLPTRAADGPVLLCSERALAPESGRLAATDVADLILTVMGAAPAHDT
jgi:hypothetical protein